MVTIEELLVWSDRRELAVLPEADALTEEDALLKAAVVDVRLFASAGTAAVLFDLRGAVHLAMGNTAVVAVCGVSHLEWRSATEEQRRWRSVMSWVPRLTQEGFSGGATTASGDRLQVAGAGAEFYVGDVAGGDAPPPDFTSATEAEVLAGMASWSSDLQVVHASFTP